METLQRVVQVVTLSVAQFLLPRQRPAILTSTGALFMSFDRHLTGHGHFYRFVVTKDPAGWEVREEEDTAVLRRAHREDWHRVERDIQLFEMRALALKREGWIEN